ncbi:PD-(D/E)XK nuclease family protein [Acinetobacter faecalis]|uniref:PD-(D/E)XK nuclease family protein n=1 Tax=Acinetobacter faecalis TaxID=2665161 RepID=UPI002A91AFEC|nr:PD-(D/E)XK nuclease family protein [Acinetobacter faecalis]MDY6468812.1 PD-(D/E)XK nuclease family protein [Acinetobacter faecalis]
MIKPNIFTFATKELSQDAFIFWLLDHANPKYKGVDSSIKNCALALIQRFFDLENKLMPTEIIEFELSKQVEGIDILLKINDYYIVVEDKTSSGTHGDQLKRYKDIALKKAHNVNENVLAIYFKTYDQSSYSKEIEEGFKIFSREQLISILNSYTNITSDIFNDFKEHINSIENEVNAFITKQEWNHQNWIGFFKYLQQEFGTGEWGYVSNKNGGFMGFWWCFNDIESCCYYLQLENNQLVIKLNYGNDPEKSPYRKKLNEYFQSEAVKRELHYDKLSRLGSGITATVFANRDYIIVDPKTKLIVLDETISLIGKYVQMVKEADLSFKILS